MSAVRKRLLTEEQMQNLIYDAQQREITVKHGERAWDHCNYGWGSAGGDDWLRMETKIYQVSHDQILTTTVNNKGEVTNEWHTR